MMMLPDKGSLNSRLEKVSLLEAKEEIEPELLEQGKGAEGAK
jgi:hypothetical protein